MTKHNKLSYATPSSVCLEIAAASTLCKQSGGRENVDSTNPSDEFEDGLD